MESVDVRIGSEDLEEVQQAAAQALALPQQQAVAALNELLFSKTQPHLSAAEGLSKLRNENRQERCGRLFQENDLAYNCRTCQTDNTCVICQDCFDASDHTGHEIMFHRTSPGGCCDCGDEEAWAPKGFCHRHGKHSDETHDGDPRLRMPAGVLAVSNAIFDVIFEGLRDALQEIFRSYRRCVLEDGEAIVERYDEIKDLPGRNTLNVVLNNDDVHTYEEVIRVMFGINNRMDEVKLSQESIEQKTSTIDKFGRALVFSRSFEDDESMKESVALLCAIRSDLESIGLLTCTSFSEQLNIEKRAISGLTWMLEVSRASQGLAVGIIERFMGLGPSLIECAPAEKYMRSRCGEFHHWPETAIEGDSLKLSFCDVAFSFDALLPKQLAKSLHSLWLYLLTNVSFKQHLGCSFLRSYSRLSSAFSCGLGTHNESGASFSVQLLTVPSVVRLADEQFKEEARDVVVEMFSTLKHFLWTCCDRQLFDSKRKTSAELDLSRKCRPIVHDRLAHFFVATMYIVKLVPFSLLDKGWPLQTKRIEAFAEMIRPMQRMNPHRRYLGEHHVEMEFDDWTRAFHLTWRLNTVLQPAAIGLASDLVNLSLGRKFLPGVGQLDLLRSLSFVARIYFDSSRCWKTGEHVMNGEARAVVEFAEIEPSRCILKGIVDGERLRAPAHKLRRPKQVFNDFEVCEGSVFNGAPFSYHLPLHRFFALLVIVLGVQIDRAMIPLEAPETFLKRALITSVDMVEFVEDVLKIFAANAQVSAQMWRRNGHTMDNMLMNYKAGFGCMMYQNDVAFAQITMCALGVLPVVGSLIVKMGLQGFFGNELRFRENGEFFAVDADTVKRTPQEIADQNLHLADEFLRLLIHIGTEIPSSIKSGRSALRRAVIHAVAPRNGKCTFSRVTESVRLAGIPFGVSSMEEDGQEKVDFLDSNNLQDGDDNMGISVAEIEGILDNVAIKRGTSTKAEYSLRPEIWTEVDPYCWNVSRSKEEVVAEQLAHCFRESKAWPITNAPPGPPSRIFHSARYLLCSEEVVHGILCNIFLNGLVDASFPVIRGSGQRVDVAELPARSEASAKTSAALTYTSLHLATICMHAVNASPLPEELAKVLASSSKSTNLSLMEILVNFEAMCRNTQDPKLPNVVWCNDEIARFHEFEVTTLRGHLGLVDKDSEELVEKGESINAEGGDKNRKKKKKKKKKKAASKKNGEEVQRILMERMRKAQESALETFAAEMEDDTDGSQMKEENFCVLCHDHIQKKQYAFVGYAQKTAWGHPLSLLTEDPCPPGILSTKRKPAGWRPAPNAQSKTGGNGTGDDLAAASSSDATASNGDMEWSMASAQEAEPSAMLDDDDSVDEVLNDEEEVDESLFYDEEEFEDDDDMLVELAGDRDDEFSIDTEDEDTRDDENGDTVDQTMEFQQALAELVAETGGALDSAQDAIWNMFAGASSSSSSRRPHMVEGSLSEAVSNTATSVSIRFCAHAMHIECLHEYLLSLRSTRQPISISFADIFSGEFQCPMCKSISNMIMPFIPESQTAPAKIDGEKRRRISSAATADDMVKFITGELREMGPRQLDEESRQHIDLLASALAKLCPSKGIREDSHLGRVFATWSAIVFSLATKEASSRPMCGETESGKAGGTRLVLELVEHCQQQWAALQRLSVVLTRSRDFGSLYFDNDVRGRASSAEMSSSSSFEAEGRGSGFFGRSSFFSSFAGAQARAAGTGTIEGSPEDTHSSSFTESFGASMMSPFTLFWGSFGHSQSSTNLQQLSEPADTKSESGSARPREEEDEIKSRKLLETASRVQNPLFQMLTMGFSESLGKLGRLLAPGERKVLVLKIPHNHEIGSAGSILPCGITLTKRDGSTITSGLEDLVIEKNAEKGIIFVHHQVAPDGVLLNMEDPVMVFEAMLCSLPDEIHTQVARAMAVATLAKALFSGREPKLCASSMASKRIEIARAWLEPLRKVRPGLSLARAYHALFVDLSRFLRCSVLMLQGISTLDQQRMYDIPHEMEYGENDEVEALWLDFLGLPPIQEITKSDDLMRIIDKWKVALQNCRKQEGLKSLLNSQCCLEKTRLRLIDLPQHFEQLLRLINKKARCPTTGKIMPQPALCLRCGAVLCSYQPCCRRSVKGAGTLHARACGGGPAIFLLVQRCTVLLVHGKRYFEISAPYVDSHGETDDGLRRGRPLKLEPSAMKHLRFVCANNAILDEIATRSLDFRGRHHSILF